MLKLFTILFFMTNPMIKSTQIREPALFKKLDGRFYGLIGPDIDKSKISTLYDLFTGDGVIQGVFFDKTKGPTFVRHRVQTEKVVHEKAHGKFSKNRLMLPLYSFLNKIGVLPNVLGLANTALININNNTFALFERDVPYHIRINPEKQTIETVKKVATHISHFSGHSKWLSGVIHTMDYDVVCRKIQYSRLNETFGELSTVSQKTEYIPLVHDFGILNDTIAYLDAPFIWSLQLNSSIPVLFDRTKPTFLHLYDRRENLLRKIFFDTAFYIFHFAYCEKMGERTDIYAPIYDNIDFSSLILSGKYRKISLLSSGEIVIKKNPVLENMNLDFPMIWGSYIILRGIINQKISEFVVCKGLDIIRKIRLPNDRFFCGEPGVVEIDGAPYLVGFSYSSSKGIKEKSFVCIIGVFTEEYVEWPINSPLTIGFHSITI